MSSVDVAAASDLLWRHWQARTRIDGLPAGMMPATREEAYRIQAVLESRSERPIAGWKIAATSEAGQAHINVDGPLAGRLPAERGFESGAELVVGKSLMRVAEPEFTFRLGEDLAPRGRSYDVGDVLAAVESLHPSLEVPDSRFNDFTVVGDRQLIADDACAHEYVIGAPASVDWRALDLGAHPVTITAADGREHQGVGANALGAPAKALAWLVNEVTGLGITVVAGQVVMTGTCAVPMPIEPGDRVEADFGALGTVSASFV